MKFIKEIVRRFRELLEKIRKKDPRKFDRVFVYLQFVITICGVFSPALITNLIFRLLSEAMILGMVLIVQWSLLTNRRIREVDEVLNELLEKEDELEKKNAEESEIWNELYSERIGNDNQISNKSITLLYTLSDQVKKLSVERTNSKDQQISHNVLVFMQKCTNDLEDILSQCYGKEIRASIKIATSSNKLRTYVRGRKNVISRGGEYIVKSRYNKTIKIDRNYAYKAIVQQKIKFFSEGDLENLQNSASKDSIFYCEHSDWRKCFLSTVIMPIRIPIENDNDNYHIFGLICIDCNEKMPVWSDIDFPNHNEYLLIAGLADNLATLLNNLCFKEDLNGIN